MANTKWTQRYFCRFFFWSHVLAFFKILLVFSLYILVSYFMFLWFYFFGVLFCMLFLYSGFVFLLKTERKKVWDLGGWGGRVGPGEIKEGETMARLYGMKKLFSIKKKKEKIMSIWVCSWVQHPQRPGDGVGVGSLGAGVPGSCEPPDLGVGKQT